ncbi:hypothetical protein D8674_003517 [Pyrus ussuriensis x Pyrus communis]|uniref:Protein kinase domain-containing protein n=1 Tax=Pyrus ussuriensis x Pyrus communis TaxID=2448454 RepID=A0A5N5FMT8_9ROSA|nr:hypothetical protein D8674_003517 [Pyrus ussuriensis x Pyrus communis]
MEKQDFDPDDNHIGLNINSVRSDKTISLKPLGIEISLEISPEIPTNYSVRVEYNSRSTVLEVYMAIHSQTNQPKKPETPLLKDTINLRQYLKKASCFGFAGSTGSSALQLNCVLKWDLKVEEMHPKKDLTWLKMLKRTRNEESNVLGTLKKLPGMPREFKYKELKEATNNFHESMRLGQGRFGIVYRGSLHDKDHANTNTSAETAVKKFSRDNIKGKDDFMAELTIIHCLHHKQLVRLYDKKVVHCDLKASNTLLDKDVNARLGEFGLAQALDQERNSCAELNYAFTQGRLLQSEMFGFGAVVLEIVCGRSPGIKIVHEHQQYSLVDWVWMLHSEGRIKEAVDERLKNDYVFDGANSFYFLGLKYRRVCQIISGTGTMPAPSVPPFKSAFTWPSMATAYSSTETEITLSDIILSSITVSS